MSSEIAPIREDEAEDCGLPSTPEHKGARLGSVWRSPGVALTPIGSPAPLRPEEKLWHEERPHASSFSFGDPFRTQERPNSAPDRVLVPASPGGVFSDLSSEAEALRLCLSAKPHPPSPEQATFHPQPRRHQPWVMPLLESEASPEALAREGTAMTSLLGEGLKHRPKPLAGSDEHSNGQTPAGTSCGTPALDASTPSPEQNGQSKDNLESPKPHHSVQNTPEPTHQYGCGAAISTPSPCAMSSLNQHMLGLPPRFNEGMPLLEALEGGPLLPPPLPAPGASTNVTNGMDYGGFIRPTEVTMPEMHAIWGMPGMRSQDPLTVQQMAMSFQAYHWGAASALGWPRMGPMPPMGASEVPKPNVNGKEVASKENGLAPQTHARTSSDASSGSQSADHKRRDLSSVPSEARELVGQVGQMSRTQAGSKYLQRQLLKGSGAAVEVILKEVEEEIASMMCDPYGNYLCSAAFQACSQVQRRRMLEKLAPCVAQIACDKRGTHALQAFIELLQLEEEQDQLMGAVKGQIVELSMDPNGTHVIQRLLTCFQGSVTDWIFLIIGDRIIEVAHHPYGLCVLKKCISLARHHREFLLEQLARHAMDLVQSPYGNYAIQHALEEWGGRDCEPILEKLEGRMMQLSIQKFSSNVVEKLLTIAPPEFRRKFIWELVESDKMSVLVNSNYGHYVVKRAMQMASGDQREALSEAIRAHLSVLGNRRLRLKWEKVMNGGFGENDLGSLKLDADVTSSSKRPKVKQRLKGSELVREQ
ncbi:unnamed protein product [Durusdinium trenchii]|uniref:Pumilio domain-containing protein C6G9.14 n=2 Tax=Durusdinium trenchii TaxID=1381693 RepID=A0ABP0JU71_9DINO